VVLSAFTFDNIPDRTTRLHLFAELRRLLAAGGRIVNLVSAPDIHVNEWASLGTESDPYHWVCETRISPWVIDVLQLLRR
jgi:hypothetical protein